MSIVDDVCELLDSYGGRDKVVRLACYTCKLYGCIKNDKGWQKAGSNLSNARMMLRLFDDIPTIRDAYNYGLGREESSSMSQFLGVLSNVVDQVYLPVEKAIWLNDMGVLKLKPDIAESLDTFSTVLWAAGIYIGLLQTLRSIQQLSWSRRCLAGSCGEARRRAARRLALQAALAGKLCLDLAHAGACLPRGMLWGERIPATTVAAVATTSSLLGIALYFAKKRLLQ